MIGGGPALGEGTVMLVPADQKTLRAQLMAAKDGCLLAEFNTEKGGKTKP